MDRTTFRAIDGDGHIRERDAEIWKYLDEPYCSSEVTLNYPFFPSLDGFQRGAFGATAGAAKRREGVIDVGAWQRLLDEIGLDYAVLYPTAGLSIGMVQDPDWAVAVCRGYNNWLDAAYRQADPRLVGVALLPLQDVDAAVKELRRSVTELGMVGGMLPANSANMGVRSPLGDEVFWPLYEEAQRLDVPLAVHGAPSVGLGIDYARSVTLANVLEHPLSVMIQLASMFLEGVFDEFPDLRVAYLEANTVWMPYMMDRMSGKKRRGRTDSADLMRSGRVLVSVEGADPGLPYAVDRLGEDAIIYATDYPHETKEMVAEELDEALARTDLSEGVLRKIYRDNAVRLYNWQGPQGEAGKQPAATATA